VILNLDAARVFIGCRRLLKSRDLLLIKTDCQIARSKKLKRPNLDESYLKGQILKNEKRPKKTNFPPKFVKITRFKVRIL